jgi:transposase
MTLRLRPLTTEEAQAIKKLSHSRTEAARLVERAKIIWQANEGQTVPQIAQTLGVGGKMVRLWLTRFAEQSLAGLQDAPRSGAPAHYSPEVRAQLIATALTPPRELGQVYSSWTFERLAAYLQERLGIAMKKTRIFEILQEEGLRWRHQETWFGERVDPAFAEKRGSSNGSEPSRPRIAPSSISTRWDQSQPRAIRDSRRSK